MCIMRIAYLVILYAAMKTLAEGAPEPPKVELRGEATSTPDGFSVAFESDTGATRESRGPISHWVALRVAAPRKIGEASLCECYFAAFDSHRRLLTTISIKPYSARDDAIQRYHIFNSEREFLGRATLSFTYCAPIGYIVKEYVVPLKDHLPAKN